MQDRFAFKHIAGGNNTARRKVAEAIQVVIIYVEIRVHPGGIFTHPLQVAFSGGVHTNAAAHETVRLMLGGADNVPAAIGWTGFQV